MNVIDTPLQNLKVIEFAATEDERGHFARTFCARVFEHHRLTLPVAQANLSFNSQMGTIRGLHFQIPPHEEAKLIRCTRGAIMNVAVDVRPTSRTFLEHFAVELTHGNNKALYVPKGFANGYQALTDGAEAAYQVSEFYTPGYERGLRFDDPRLNIRWPMHATLVSVKDRSWPLLDEVQVGRICRESSSIAK